MKIKLDTTIKNISLEENVNLGELFNVLNQILPDNEWKQYTLKVEPFTTFINPIKIEIDKDPNPFRTDKYPREPWPWITFEDPKIYCLNVEKII